MLRTALSTWWRKAAAVCPLRLSIAVLALPSVLTLLGGCGFHPLYGVDAIDPDVERELASIRVDPIKDRQGQLVRNALLTDLSPHGEPQQERYRLEVFLQVSEGQEAISTDTTSTRDVQSFGVTYRLYDGRTAIAAGHFTPVFSFNFLQQHYSNVAALDDVRQRAGQDIADAIRDRLANYFSAAKEAAAKRASAAR